MPTLLDIRVYWHSVVAHPVLGCNELQETFARVGERDELQ